MVVTRVKVVVVMIAMTVMTTVIVMSVHVCSPSSSPLPSQLSPLSIARAWGFLCDSAMKTVVAAVVVIMTTMLMMMMMMMIALYSKTRLVAPVSVYIDWVR